MRSNDNHFTELAERTLSCAPQVFHSIIAVKFLPGVSHAFAIRSIGDFPDRNRGRVRGVDSVAQSLLSPD